MKNPGNYLLAGILFAASTNALGAQRVDVQRIEWLTRDSTAGDMWAYVAPDGQTITFSRSRDGGQTWELLRTTRSGTPPVAFLRTPVAVSATRGAWSRRHNRLAFTGGTRSDDSTALWVSDAAGQKVTRVPAQVSPGVMYPSWRPDGRTLVAVDYKATGGSTLVEIDVESGAARPLTSPAEFQVGMPAVAPDGEALVFAGQRNEGREYDQTKNQIWLLPRGGVPREISRGQGRQPDWSPDGRWIAFTSRRGDSTGRHAVFIVSREGGEPIRLTDYASNGQHPVWSPDGQWLVFSAQLPAKAPAFGLAIIPVPRAAR